MFQQVIPRSFLWLVSIWAALTIGITGCGGDDDDNEWVGTWSLESIDGETLEQVLAEGEELGIDFSIDPNRWTFDDDGTMEVEFGVEFKAEEQGFVISGQGSIKIIGTYSLSGSSYTLTPTEVEGTGLFEGTLPPIGPTDEGTGTWSREGNTLTLNDADGSTLVLKKK